MKIAIVSPYFFPKVGGLESYVYYVSKELIRNGHDVVVITSGEENSTEKFDGLTVYRLKTTLVLSNTPIGFFWLYQMYRIFREERPDVISAHSPVPFIADIASLLSTFSGIPFVLTYHAGSFKKDQFLADLITNVYSNTVERVMFHQAKKIIALNEFVQSETLKSYHKKVKLIKPGITLQNTQQTVKRTTRKRILFVGKLDRTHEWKGLSYLIQALPIILKEKLDISLTIVGGGDYLHFYKKLTEQLNIQPYVTFIGHVANGEMSEFYQSHDLLVLPSYSNAESFGLVMIEAMKFGLPVVATTVGGIPFTIKDDVNGKLVEPKNPVALANAITTLFEDKKLFDTIRKNNLLKSKEYDWKIHIQQLEKNFNEIIKR